MKNLKSFLTISLLTLPLSIVAQTWTLYLPMLGREEGKTLQWIAQHTAEFWEVDVLNQNLMGYTKDASIQYAEQTWHFERRKDIKALRSPQGDLKVLIRSNRYIMSDGARFLRTENGFVNRIRILDEEGQILAEGDIKIRLFDICRLTIKIINSTPYDQEFLAMLTVDLMDRLNTEVIFG